MSEGGNVKARKTWREKLERDLERRIIDTPDGKMLVSRPLDVDAVMREIPHGKLVTIGQIRTRLAKDFHSDYTCPLTTGIFIRIAAEAAEEDLAKGVKQITPYWRAIRNDGGLNEKSPGGVERQASRLRDEGHIVDAGREKKQPRVRDFENSLAEL